MVKFYNEIEDLIIYKEVFSKLLVCFFNAMLDVTMFVSSYRSVPGTVYRNTSADHGKCDMTPPRQRAK